MNECTIADINNILSLEDFSNPSIRDLMLARIYALTGCSMRSQKRLWKAFGESASIRLFDKMDEFINAANNLFALFDSIDEKKTEIDTVSLKVYTTMMNEFVTSRNVWIRDYDRGIKKAKEEKIKQKCGQKKKGYTYGDFR